MKKEIPFIPNSTQTPNIVYDFLNPRIPNAESRCVNYVCRRTYGFHKDEDQISYSQFLYGIVSKNGKRLDYGCGLKSRASLSEALKNLVKSGAFIIRRSNKGNFYKLDLNMDVDKVVQKINQFRKCTRIGLLTKPKQVHLPNIQKKGNNRK